ncbi:MAG: RHS repeat-associated core domain-containing protein [Bacteroidales bacterium]|nr:RHS repeat-associated core domain-containing protein [Bacteroidales bacterium]
MNIKFDTRCKFTTKELDNETNYTYFGTRYYDSELSVDPMASFRSCVSPYSYCQNNPIGRIDPTGALDGDFYDQKGKYFGTDASGNEKVIWVAITGSNNTIFEWVDIMYINEGISSWRSYRGIIDPIEAAKQINIVNGVHIAPWNDFVTK